jgi:predicted nucleic acid-binding protein
MIVVADISPLNYLILIYQIDVLESLYGGIVMPSAVREELLHPSAPTLVKEWAGKLPPWIEVHEPGAIIRSFPRGLGAGEREAIAFAHLHKADLVLIDEKLGRREAQLLGLQVIGTLGILQEAHERGLLDIREAVRRLQGTTFQIAPSLLRSALESA